MSYTPLTFFEPKLDLSALDQQLSITSLPGEGNDQQCLPNELLRHVFLYSDPHTLYTSVRALDTHWKNAVETDLLHELFRTQTWRVGLRVSKKKALSQSAMMASAADSSQPASDQENEEESEESEEELTACLARQDSEINSLMATPGVTEEEVNTLLASFAATSAKKAAARKARSILHVIPLTFQRYDPESTSLAFGTGAGWHALFDGFSAEQQSGSRLDLDFGLCWRFPGDGQEVNSDSGASAEADDKAKSDAYWGEPDIENGWLSRFYCVSVGEWSDAPDSSVN